MIDQSIRSYSEKKSKRPAVVRRILEKLHIAPPVQKVAIPSKNELIEREAAIGRQVFGQPDVHGASREFFYLDNHTWIWIERWQDALGVQRSLTTRYEIRNGNIIKVQEGQNYQYVEHHEAVTLLEAVRAYRHAVKTHIYSRPINS